jgi:hypothetical protein
MVRRCVFSRNVVNEAIVRAGLESQKKLYIHIYIYTYIQIGHVSLGKIWYSSILDVRSFRGADCDTDHYLVLAKVRERLAVSKQEAHTYIRTYIHSYSRVILNENFLLVVLSHIWLYLNLCRKVKHMHYEIFDVTVDNQAYVDVARFCSKWVITS